MADQRLHTRLVCEARCHFHLRDSFYLATVRSVSLGGVLLCLDNLLPGVHVGDKCKVSLGEGLFCEYDCKVISVEASNIALKFIGMSW